MSPFVARLVRSSALVLVLAAGPAALAPLCAAPAPPRLVILHTNDTHGQLYPTDPPENLGGVARRASLLNRLRAEAADAGEPVLLLDAGDVNTGTMESDVSKGRLDMAAMNAMRYDAMCLGNHEFDLDLPETLGFVGAARFPVLAANVRRSSGELLVKGWTMLKAGDFQVAVIGLTTPETPTTSTHGRDFPGTFGPSAPALEAALAEIGDRADLVVVLSHLGEDEDRALIPRFAGRVTAWIGGHTHTQYGVIYPDHSAYARAGSKGRWVGRLEIELPEDQAPRVVTQEFHAVDATLGDDPAVAALVPPQSAGPPVAVSVHVLQKNPLAGPGTSSVLGNFIADALRFGTRADVAVMNRGGIRTTLPSGELRERQLYALCPFRNKLFRYTITGRQLESVMADCLRLGAASPGFLEVAGMKVRLASDARLAITVGDKPLDPAGRYTLAVADFMAKGGDGYEAFKTLPAPEVIDVPPSDMLIAWARKLGTVAPDPTLRMLLKPGRHPAPAPTPVKPRASGILERIRAAVAGGP